MKEYSDFPPFKYFLRVLKNCPKSALLYIELWQKRGAYSRLSIKKRHIRKDFLISPTLFRNLIIPMMFLNVLKYVENDGQYQIDVLGNSVDE